MTEDTSNAGDEPVTDADRLMGLVASAAISQAMAVAAELGLADLLADGPRMADELARATGCHAPSLQRLMRALASADLCEEREDGSFALTAMGALLGGHAGHGLRSWAIWWGKYRWPVWGKLRHSVATGESAVGIGGATVGMRQLHQDPAAAAVFHRAMSERSRVVASAVVGACDFSGTKRLVDVGGGYGEMLAAILLAYPAMQGVLFDQAHAMDGARQHLARAGVIDRCELVPGDFFESVPGGADAYLLKTVIHDWNDEQSALILRNCRTAMAPRSKLMLVEQVMPERMTASPAHLRAAVHDLNMLVMLGGRERTASEFRNLLAAVGLLLTGITRTALDFNVIEATAA